MSSTTSTEPVANKKKSSYIQPRKKEHHRSVVKRRRFVTQQEELKTFPGLAKPSKKNQEEPRRTKEESKPGKHLFFEEKTLFGSIASLLYIIYIISWIALPTSTDC